MRNTASIGGLFISLILSCASTASAHAPSKGEDAAPRRQLVEACETLRNTAIRGPYGWGWSSDLLDENLKVPAKAPAETRATQRRKGAAPDINLRVTAAAGLLLHLAGEHLDSDVNREAAIQAARAIASVQLPTGQIPPMGRLVPKPAGHPENVGIVPDRAPTCAALGLMLLVVEANKDKPDARIVSAATRAATWLARQQTSSGGWQTAYPLGDVPKARRLIRLDFTGYRDATLALLLAAQVLERREYAMAADRSIDQLLKLRILDEGAVGEGLWGSAHTLGGEPVRDIEELPPGADLTATRHAIETLLGAQFLTKSPALPKELAAVATAADALPRVAGIWQPHYELFPRNDVESAPSKETEDTSKENDEAEPTFDSPAFGRAVELAKASEKVVAALTDAPAWELNATSRVAAMLCEVSYSEMTWTPLSPEIVQSANQAASDIIGRTWSKLLQVKLEAAAAKK